MQLKKFIAKTKIIVFSPNDKIMHAIKMPFAFFSEQKKTRKFHGILLKTDDKNTIISLNASFMQFENVMQFFGVISNSTNHLLANYYDDIEFKQIAKDWGINSSTLKNVVSMPVIDLELLKNQLVYLPGQIVAHKINLQTFLNRRGKLLVNILHKTFALFCTFFSQKYLLDLHTSQISSFPSLSFTLVWLQYCIQGGPFLHGPEKIKNGYEKLLRQYSKGGFSWSFGGKIDSGEVFKNKNGQHQTTAKSIIELDICSSYGFGAANMSCPSGFTVGYFTSSPQNKNNLIVENCDSFRHRHYEFRATYFFVLCLIKEGAEIVSIYSNYHLLGIFYVAQYPLDLFVVTKHHGNHLVQFDHLFTHGCRYGCSGLNKYAGNKTRLQLENQSQQRDNTIYQWIQDLGKENFYYHIVAECHTNGFNMKNLNAAYIHEPILHNLIKPYLKLPSKEFVLLNLPKLDSDLTFILFCQGHIPKKNQHTIFPPLFVWKMNQNNQLKQDFAYCTHSNIMLSQNHYNYLVKEHNFIVDSVLGILFFKKDYILPKVFETLIHERYLAGTNSSKVNVIKSIVNYACGYFGKNNNKIKNSSRKKWLVTGISNHIKTNFNCYHFQGVGEFQEKVYFTRQKLVGLKSLKTNSISNTPLPIFCCIIDYGKYRLNQCLHFIENIVTPGSIQLLYIHIDNMLLVLSKDKLEQIIDKKKLYFYKTHQNSYFYQAKKQLYPLPGQLKEIFCVSSPNWKFSSPVPCFYALVNCQNENNNVCKMSSVSNISPEKSYQSALKFLNNNNTEPIYVTQQRRIDKLSNTKTKTIQIKLNPPK